MTAFSGQRTADSKRQFAVGVDFGATRIKMGLVNNRGKVLARKVVPTLKDISPAEFVRTVKNEITELLSDSFKCRDCVGIGIGAPGLVDSQRGIVQYLVNIKGWENVPIAQALERRIRLPVKVDNDANVMTLGELVYGAGRGCKNLVCLTLGTGVGGGIIIGGELYRGATHAAGEIGHVAIEQDGRPCACGGMGCVEAYVGNRRIIALGKGKFSSPKQISDAARRGDRFALSIWEQVGTHLGTALASVVNLLNPEKIVIGGGVANAGGLLLDIVRKTVKKRAMKGPAGSVKIVKAQLGDNAGIVGGAVLAFSGQRTAFSKTVR